MKGKNKILSFRLLFLCLSVGVMAVIFIFSSQTGESSSAISGQVSAIVESAASAVLPDAMVRTLVRSIRKIAHVFLYFCLGATLSPFFFTFSFQKKWLYFLLPTGACLFYACLDELHQYFVPGRVCSAGDVAIDSVGFLSAILVCNLIFLFLRKKNGHTMPEF